MEIIVLGKCSRATSPMNYVLFSNLLLTYDFIPIYKKADLASAKQVKTKKPS